MEQKAENAIAAYREYDREMTIRKTQLGCFLGITLVPLFAVVDHQVYPQHEGGFFYVRLACSLMMAALYPLLKTKLGQRYYRGFGLLLLLLPSTSIAWMLCASEQGAASWYYAGLNLVLLVLAVVLDWTFWQSLAAVSLVLLLYSAVCLISPPPADQALAGLVVNNFCFLLSTGIVIVIAAYFHSSLRLREFVSRHELDQSRQELARTNEKLLELGRVKDRFFANISHELRTPLTLLLGPLEKLQSHLKPSLDSETTELLSIMHSNGMRLLRLINDLLDLVRLESGRMELKQESLDVSDFIKGLASAVRQLANEKQIMLTTQIDPQVQTVMADRDKLEKILLNLIFNALKFTPRGGKVELRVERRSQELILAVSDTGIGISEKNLPFVFDRFWQADTSSKRNFQGVGIGLALVKELTELQGGSVKAESQEGHGTTFTIYLPYVQSQTTLQRSEAGSGLLTQESAIKQQEWVTNLYRRAEFFPATKSANDVLAAAGGVTRKGNGPRVLVADDEPDMLRFLSSQLDKHYQVLEAGDGQHAVETACRFPPDIILLDMMMPRKDGLQACRELRQNSSTQNIPIILLTARADEETKLLALSAGASDFLPKPFSTTELHVRIKNLVVSHDYQRKLARQNELLEHTIDQLKETETQLVQSEKLASLGRLSAGMIHEINNPLNFATTGLFTLRAKEKCMAEEERGEYLEILNDVEEGIRRVRDLVISLRMFSYPDNEKSDLVSMSEVLEPALRFLSHEWKEKVDVHTSVPEDVAICGNKNKLIQVLVNLLQNSLDTLERKSFTAEKPAIWIEGRYENDKSILSVRDNGEGIQPDHMDKIFDPFFTTKDVGEGMGLGLSICYRIVQQYGGRIHVKSQAGVSSEFRLEFPRPTPESAQGG